MRSFDETLAMFSATAQNGPFYFLLLRPWFFLVGTSEFALRYPSVLLGTASVPLFWQVVRQLAPGEQWAWAMRGRRFCPIRVICVLFEPA